MPAEVGGNFGILKIPNIFKMLVKIMSIWDLKRPYFVYYEGPGPLSDDGI